MNGWIIAGGLAGVCLLTAYAWLVIADTYDKAYRDGFADGCDFGRKEVAR